MIKHTNSKCSKNIFILHFITTLWFSDIVYTVCILTGFWVPKLGGIIIALFDQRAKSFTQIFIYLLLFHKMFENNW